MRQNDPRQPENQHGKVRNNAMYKSMEPQYSWVTTS
jgi:hypothetical protein